MSKVITMLVALALFGALPAVAAAQTTPGGDGTVSSGNTQNGTIDQDAETGGDDGVDGDGHGGGGNAGNQACLIQQNAGRDANAACDQSQHFGAGGVNNGVNRHAVGRGGGTVGTGSAGVSGVTLARTGFDAWLLALVGGFALAGGIAMLVQRRLAS